MTSLKIIDIGSSAPYEFSNSVPGQSKIVPNIIVAETPLPILIAEFGLQINQTPTNYVHLTGTVGLTTSLNIQQDVTITITRDNVDPNIGETSVFSTTETLVPATNLDFKKTISFATMDGGNNTSIPPGYYAYRLYVYRTNGTQGTTGTTWIDGPIAFTGTSYVKPILNP